jgi:hypothetical protein
MLIATVPSPHKIEDLKAVLEEPMIGLYRFNVGARTPFSPRDTLELILQGRGSSSELIDPDRLIIDLDWRQLRIGRWIYPGFGEIELNHELEVELPALAVFRGGSKPIRIVAVKENKIYLEHDPYEALGAGQAINVHGENLVISGSITDEDREYVRAAKELGIHRFMISFTEEADDVYLLHALDRQAKIYAKIESLKGLEFVRTAYPRLKEKYELRLVAALDDLFVNIGDDKTQIFEALELIINQDAEAIAASRILISLEKEEEVSMCDLTGLRFLQTLGYRHFMLSDGLCNRQESFQRAMATLRQYQGHFEI